MTLPFSSGYRATQDGVWVNAMHQRVATMVAEYDPEIFLAWIPPADRQPGDENVAYMLVHEHPNGQQYAMSYWSHDEINPDAVLSWLWENDFRKHHPNDIFNKVQASALAQQLYDAKVTEEETMEKLEFAESVLKSKKHFYKHKGKTYT